MLVVASVEMQRAEKKPTSTTTTQQIVYIQNPSPVGMMQPGQSVQPIIYQQGPGLYPQQQQGIKDIYRYIYKNIFPFNDEIKIAIYFNME